jgi:carboxypeptidase family protein/TonB-dependent receptor-like protein
MHGGRTHVPWRLLLALCACAPAPAAAQTGASLLVQVTAAESGAPLFGAQVTVDGRARGATDAGGVLRVEGLSAARHRVAVTLLGRRTRDFTLELPAGEATEVEVQLEPDPVTLRGVEAEAAPQPRSPALRAFYNRMRNSSVGYFVGREEIEAQRGKRFTDLFRRIPNVQVAHGCAGWMIRFNRAGPGRKPSESEEACDVETADCPPRWYVDGVPANVDLSPDMMFRIPDIEGIEVYSGIVPVEFGGGQAGCGVIAVWTRERG